jgi:hypothetical protein
MIVRPRFIVDQFVDDQIDRASIKAIRGWRVGYQNAGGKVVKEPLDMLWRELRSPTVSSVRFAASATSAA